jgi:high-affinity iron transporter
MISTLVIVFRESLEAALIVSIVMAASRGIAGRTAYVVGGLIAGLIGAGVVAVFADAIAGMFEGSGSELFNAVVLLAAVAMLTWHQAWMSSHGREMAANARELGENVRSGARPLSALAIVTAVAVLREGSETVLFLYGIAAEGSSEAGSMVVGGLVGFVLAVVVGWLIYTGLARISMKYIFKVTGIIITLLAAGLAAQAAAFLVQTGWLPPLGNRIWDTSWLLSQDGIVGQFLHIVVGYVAQPQGIQIVAYVLTLILILIASAAARRSVTAHRHEGSHSAA